MNQVLDSVLDKIHGGFPPFPFQHSNDPVHRRIYQHMERRKSFVSSMEEGVRRTQEGNFAFIGEAVSLDLAVARYCTLTRSQDVIGMRSYALAAPQGEFNSWRLDSNSNLIKVLCSYLRLVAQ